MIYSSAFAVAAIKNQRMTKLVSFGVVAAGALLGACGSSARAPELHSVGTYIGGGSMRLGTNDECTYTGSAAGVFEGDEKPATEANRGPRYVTGVGTITRDCSGTKTRYEAVMPTAAMIDGPATLKLGSEDLNFLSAHLVANGKRLAGEASLDWGLGPDCNGVAEFAPVTGSQDTGGPSRSRSLVVKAKGTCTVLLTAQTGENVSYPSFKGATFQAQHKVAIN